MASSWPILWPSMSTTSWSRQSRMFSASNTPAHLPQRLSRRSMCAAVCLRSTRLDPGDSLARKVVASLRRRRALRPRDRHIGRQLQLLDPPPGNPVPDRTANQVPIRNRIHIDIYLPHDQVEGRIAAAVAAGGRVISGKNAPGWWTLADPEGNEVDLAIWMAD